MDLIDLDEPTQRIVHIHPERTQLGRIYPTDIGVCGDPSVTIGALRETERPDERTAVRCSTRRSPSSTAHASHAAGPLDMGEAMRWLQANAPADVIFTNGAGNFSVWNNKGFRYGPQARLLAPQNGTMGYGLPAIAAKAAHPDRTVVCFAGDGDLQMTIQELGTARQAGYEPIVLVFDNGCTARSVPTKSGTTPAGSAAHRLTTPTSSPSQ